MMFGSRKFPSVGCECLTFSSESKGKGSKDQDAKSQSTADYNAPQPLSLRAIAALLRNPKEATL